MGISGGLLQKMKGADFKRSSQNPTFPLDKSGTVAPAIWTAGVSGLGKKQPPAIRMAAYMLGVLGGWSVCSLPPTWSQAAPFLAATKDIHWYLSD